MAENRTKLNNIKNVSVEKSWTFLSNHGHVLVYLARNPECLIRDLALAVGITERSAQGIIADLVAEGYVRVTKRGRRNKYKVITSRKFRHPTEDTHSINSLVSIFL